LLVSFAIILLLGECELAKTRRQEHVGALREALTPDDLRNRGRNLPATRPLAPQLFAPSADSHDGWRFPLLHRNPVSLQYAWPNRWIDTVRELTAGFRSKVQVLIAGAGPVGMTAAAELARYGVQVRIIDQAPQRTDKSKALVLWSRTLELLDRARCTPAFVAAGMKVHAASLVAGGNLVAHVSLRNVASQYNYALMLPQSETERLLDEHLGRLGVTVERNNRAYWVRD
jgi:FAD binding domain